MRTVETPVPLILRKSGTGSWSFNERIAELQERCERGQVVRHLIESVGIISTVAGSFSIKLRDERSDGSGDEERTLTLRGGDDVQSAFWNGSDRGYLLPRLRHQSLWLTGALSADAVVRMTVQLREVVL